MSDKHETGHHPDEPVALDVEEKPIARGRWIMRKQRVVKEDGRILIYYDFKSPDSETRNPQ